MVDGFKTDRSLCDHHKFQVPKGPAACIENTGQGSALGQYKVLNRLRYRAAFAPDSTPGLFMSIGSLITLIERREHDEPTEEELALPLSHPRNFTRNLPRKPAVERELSGGSLFDRSLCGCGLHRDPDDHGQHLSCILRTSNEKRG